MSLLDSLLQPDLIDDALMPKRRSAAEHLRERGLPGARDEAWRYTTLRSLSTKSFALSDVAAATRELPTDIATQVQSASPRLVFVNGVMRRDWSTLDALPSGLSIDPGVPAAGLEVSPASAGRRDSEVEVADAFDAANLARAQDGAGISVSADALIAEPLHLFLIHLSGEATAVHTRIALNVAEGAAFTLVERHIVDASCADLDNEMLDCTIGSKARFTHVRTTASAMHLNALHHSRYQLAADSQVCTFEMTPGLALQRHRMDVALNGDGSRFVSGGVQALRGRAHSDVHISVRHQALNTSCDLIWRGIADQRARLGFTGNLVVAVGADGSDARLSSKNLLLSQHAEINTRPVLIIHADEVKAAHGATVGRLDEQAMFYLRSRGIGRQQARDLLTQAFAIEALQVLDGHDVQPMMTEALAQALSGFVEAEDHVS